MSGDSGEINLPFDLSIGYQIRLTHRLMQKLLQLKIEQFGVTLGMWYFLRVLWDQDGLCMAVTNQANGAPAFC